MVWETRVPGENHRPAEVTDKLFHIMYRETPRVERDSNSQL